MKIPTGKRNGTPPRSRLSSVARPLALGLALMLLAACGTTGTLTTDAATCAAVKRSPLYSGKKLEAAVGKPFRLWVVTTNGTLKRLGCPNE